MRKILTFSLLLILLSCNGDEEPENILSKQEMVDILIDLHIAEAVASTKYSASDSSRIYYKGMEKRVLEKYKTNKEIYSESYTYYMTNIEQMDEIYAAVVDSLSLREARNFLEK